MKYLFFLICWLSVVSSHFFIYIFFHVFSLTICFPVHVSLLFVLYMTNQCHFDWLMIAYIALFSALLSRLTALACGATWVTSFLERVFEYPPKWCTYSAGMAGATWNCSRFGVSSVYTIQPCHFMHSHIRKVYACLTVTCHLHLTEWPGSFTCYCGNTGGGTDTEIRVSTDSRPWRRKFSHRSCRDSNPRPFSHESGALTTELSPPPMSIC